MFSSARTGWPPAARPARGLARGDLADERQPLGLHERLHGVDPTLEQLDGPGLRGVAAQEADLLEIREVRVHRRGGGETHGLADVAHGRRIAVLRVVLLNEVEDLLLALGQAE